MTNKEDGDRGKSKATAITAVDLVSQVLDEAYCIANAAKDSGQPWLYYSMITSLRRCENNIDDEETSLAVLKDDSYANENNTQLSANVLATSTPQKGNVDSSFLAREDDFNTGKNELNNSTSPLISDFFEMSQIDCNICRDDAVLQGTKRIQQGEVSEIISKIDPLDVQLDQASKDSTGSFNLSNYSFLSDFADIAAMGPCSHNNIGISSSNHDEPTSTVTKKDEVWNYEETYLTLNRDYEHFAEDDADGLFPVLKDTRGLTFQEIELLTACSVENIYPSAKPERTNRASTLTTSEVNKGLHRDSVVRRCRLQSSRLLTSLRRWWGRKKRSATRGISQNLSLNHNITEQTSAGPISS